MTHSVPNLRENLLRLQKAIEQDSLLPLLQEDRERLNQEALRILERIAALDEDFLTVGLIGGTGVGKSTLMNALAEAPISSVSHRRPHTDHVIIYRHEKAGALQASPTTALRWTEVVHNADAVRQILLCDLPDFDSLIAAHREGVLEFLSQLDLLVWVTSPEKYADSRFYEFLRIAPKAKSNFLFVLNKCDQLFDGDTRESGYAKLDAISRLLNENLSSEGIESPTFFTISSIEATGKGPISPWNSFPLLSKLIFQQRDIKGIQAIKKENLDVEAEKIFLEIRDMAKDLESLESMLAEMIDDWNNNQKAWIQSGKDILSAWLESENTLKLFRYPEQEPPLIGPGLIVGSLFSALGREKGYSVSQEPILSKIEPPEDVQIAFRRLLEWVEDRLYQKILLKNPPPMIQERIREITNVERRFNKLGEKFFSILVKGVPFKVLGGTRTFKLVQRLTYFVLLILLVLALGNASAWRDITLTPGGTAFFNLIVSIIRNLFSEKGLAALGSYTLINIFFSIRFYLRYRKRLRRSAEKIAASLHFELASAWEGCIRGILQGLLHFRDEAEHSKDTLKNSFASLMIFK